MEVAAIDQRHLHLSLTQFLRRVQAAEAAAHDHDAMLRIHVDFLCWRSSCPPDSIQSSASHPLSKLKQTIRNPAGGLSDSSAQPNKAKFPRRDAEGGG